MSQTRSLRPAGPGRLQGETCELFFDFIEGRQGRSRPSQQSRDEDQGESRDGQVEDLAVHAVGVESIQEERGPECSERPLDPARPHEADAQADDEQGDEAHHRARPTDRVDARGQVEKQEPEHDR